MSADPKNGRKAKRRPPNAAATEIVTRLRVRVRDRLDGILESLAELQRTHDNLGLLGIIDDVTNVRDDLQLLKEIVK